jgi:hypothetical protein
MAGKNGWTLAEVAWEATPDGIRMLNSANWDVDGVRDDLRGYLVEHLGEPAGVLIVDLSRHRDYAEPQAVSAAE